MNGGIGVVLHGDCAADVVSVRQKRRGGHGTQGERDNGGGRTEREEKTVWEKIVSERDA